ncbi:MAG: DoxX family protein, partial [Pseudomonadota bacterium]
VYAGTYAEFILPVLIVVGLFTRLAALGMIGFVFVQSFVDITGHHADAETIGAWFDRFSDATILDQRAMWVFLLAYLAIYGAGKLSIDQLLRRDTR